MIVDFDDFHEGNSRLDLLRELKHANPLFKCTLFAVPGKGSWDFWESVPRWCELAVHGWTHNTPTEAEAWSATMTERVMSDYMVRTWFARGFKAPGWQISEDTYLALRTYGWWVADQPYNDDRRPTGILTHRLGEGDHWHGHIQNECGNGLEECFDELLERVITATHFDYVSESVKPWRQS